jgi:type II secretory pathway predicted ATPase ExeA
VIEKLKSHYGFTKTPFGRALAPQMLHRHATHAEAVARIGWCISERGLAVVTGEVGAGRTVAVRATSPRWTPAGARGSTSATLPSAVASSTAASSPPSAVSHASTKQH